LKTDGIKFLNLNIRSLVQKFRKVDSFLAEHEVDIFGITETNLFEKDHDKDFEIRNYTLVRRDRPAYETRSRDKDKGISRPGGGLALYVHKDFKVTTVPEPTDYYKKDVIEYLIVKLRKGEVSISLILVYSPRPNNKDLTERLAELIVTGKKYKPANEVYIIGDINIDLLRDDLKIANNVKSMLVERKFFPLIREPTRVTKTSAKCIDLICANCDPKLMVKSGVVNLNWSDHYLVYGVRKE
jgi:exonuclease III